MKKTYYQTNIFFQIFVILFVPAFAVFEGLAIRVILLMIEKVPSEGSSKVVGRILIFLVFQIMALLVFRVFLRFEHNNIHIKNNTVFMKDDWMLKNEKIQFPTVVDITQIKAIDIIWSSKNSKGKYTPGRTIGGMLPKAYLSFEEINGEKKNMLILYMSKKTIRCLVDDIKSLMIRNNNINSIEDTDLLVKKFTSHRNLRISKK